ncbi:MAG: hypothetical protein M1816_002705 [Peltula sp. TS41687]|nr:MAG: hypothetical protein M1816_002705 [Peltula sp. TS41687]
MAYQGPPYGGPPPQGGYQQPPPGQYPPPSSPYPQGYPPNQYGQAPPPGQQYPPPQGQYGPPSSGPYGQQPPPAAGGYGGPAQVPYGAPPQGPYGAPYGGPPAGYPGGYQQPLQGPPQSPYNQPPPLPQHPTQPSYGMQPPPPSPGYVPGQMAGGDASQDAAALNGAMKGFGTDERTLIQVLSKKDPLQMALLVSTFQRKYGKSLSSWIESETSSYFRDGLIALVRGPLGQDVYNVHRAIKGLGTKEDLLNDVVLSRTNADLNAIKQEYQRTYRLSLEKEIREDLSMKTAELFQMVMAAQRAEESAPVIPQDVDRDVMALHQATSGGMGTDQTTTCRILSSRSDGQLRAIAQAYERRHGTKLERVIEKEFSGHMEDALLMILRGATDRAMRDALLLEDTMRGAGTKDDMLLNRVIRYHWDRNHMAQVKGAYRHGYKRELASRIKGETRGDFEKLLLACIE